jgi:hypothetical protein
LLPEGLLRIDPDNAAAFERQLGSVLEATLE